MPKVNDNADDYAAGRQGIFFPASTANGGDSQNGDLTGQCVTLNKWFLAEMTDVPGPFKARGHAKDVGRNLVAQGHADLIPNGQQRRGDFVVYEYGQYGHIGVLLSGNRLFQQNANVAGVKRIIVDGAYVYSSIITQVFSSLGGVAPKYYRIRTYREGAPNMPTLIDEEGVRILAVGVLNRPEPLTTTPDLVGHIGGDALEKIKEFWYSPEGVAANAWQQNAPRQIAELNTQVAEANAKIQELGSRPSSEDLKAAQEAIAKANEAAIALEAKYKQIQAERDVLAEQQKTDQSLGEAFLRFLGNFFKKG